MPPDPIDYTTEGPVVTSQQSGAWSQKEPMLPFAATPTFWSAPNPREMRLTGQNMAHTQVQLHHLCRRRDPFRSKASLYLHSQSLWLGFAQASTTSASQLFVLARVLRWHYNPVIRD